MSQYQTYPRQQVFSFTAAVEGAERSGWMVQVTVKVLVQSHQPFLLFIRLVHYRKLWTGGKEMSVSSNAAREGLLSGMPKTKNHITYED